MKNYENKLNYGNWVPEKLLILLWSLSALAIILLISSIFWFKNTVLIVIFAVLTVIALFYAAFMQIFHHSFSFTGGKLMGKVHDYLLSKLDWDGNGIFTDIGCGSGALTIKCAKKFPESRGIGLDYWGVVWNYAKEQCENNAKLENVSTVKFVKGDASHLIFEDETIDCAVSNFVFHEVRTVHDKRKLVYEALRVVKKGGSFAFHDLFEQKNLYGNMTEFIEELKKSGISEIHYEPHTENLPFVPKMIKPMFKNMGIIYGKK